jgi:uncharacterized SAM-binding protein YcdF (DUF218 family)
MFLYEILKSFALLPACLVLAYAVALMAMVRWRRASVIALCAITMVFYLCAAPFASHRLSQWVSSVPPLSGPAALAQAQAMVILSAGEGASPQYGGVMLDGMTLQRLRYGAHLYRQTKLPILVSGGGVPGVAVTLAAAMKAALEEDFGVAVTWVEDKSANTAENAAFSAAILRSAHISKIALVTDASHMPRALALFRAAGLDVIPAATGYTVGEDDFPRDYIPRMSAFLGSYNALYEAAGQIWYWVRPPRLDRLAPDEHAGDGQSAR